MSSLAASDKRTFESVISDCAAVLRRVAEYRLPTPLDQRLLWLSENKESLADAERQELLALVELVEEKTLEKLHARAALQRVGQVFPKLAETA